MLAYGLKSIDVQTQGNDIIIELKGEFIDTRYSLKRIEVKPRNSGIELSIITDFDQNMPISTNKVPIHEKLSVTSLHAGVYYVRVDNNNNWVKWFKVENGAVITTASSKY